MKKILFILMLFTSACMSAQNWTTEKTLKSPINHNYILEYTFDEGSYKAKLSPVFKDMILLETSEPIGKVRISRFRHTMTAKMTVFLYDMYGRKVDRFITPAVLSFMSPHNSFPVSIRSKKLYEYLMNNRGEIVIHYISFTGETIQLVIPCWKQ